MLAAVVGAALVVEALARERRTKFERFDLQVAGHGNIEVWEGRPGVIFKPWSAREETFYREAPSDVRSLLPEFLGVETIVRNHEELKFIALENFTSKFAAPSIMDLKIGFVLFREDASGLKKYRMQVKTANTTSGSIGLRVCGMHVRTGPGPDDCTDYGKEYGRTLTKDTFPEAFEAFIPDEARRPQLIAMFRERIKTIYKRISAIDGPEIRSSSLLLVYDREGLAVDVRMIDFAQSRFTQGHEQDINYIEGLEHLLNAMAHKSAVGVVGGFLSSEEASIKAQGG